MFVFFQFYLFNFAILDIQMQRKTHTQNNKQYSTTDMKYIHKDKVLRQMAGTPQQ